MRKRNESLSCVDPRVRTQSYTRGIPLAATRSDVNQRVNKWVVNTTDGTGMTNLVGPNKVAERSTNDQKLGESWRCGGKQRKVCVFCHAHLTTCRTENTFISHTKASHRATSIGVTAVLSNTNHWNHLPNLLRGCVNVCVTERCHLPQR